MLVTSVTKQGRIERFKMSRANVDQGNMRVSVMGVLVGIYVYVREAELRSRVTAHQRRVRKKEKKDGKRGKTDVHFTLILYMHSNVRGTICLQNKGYCFIHSQRRSDRHTGKKTDKDR